MYLAHKICELRVETSYFFRMAHQWKFNIDANVSRDVIEYEVAGIVPRYVQDYVQHLQQKERENALPKVS